MPLMILSILWRRVGPSAMSWLSKENTGMVSTAYYRFFCLPPWIPCVEGVSKPGGGTGNLVLNQVLRGMENSATPVNGQTISDTMHVDAFWRSANCPRIARRGLQIVLAFWLFVATVASQASERPPVPTIDPTRAATPPVIDGRLDDACWRDTEPISEFWNVEGNAQFKELQWAKVASDDEAIYISYHMQADPKSELPAGSKTRDEGVWFSPNIQVFVQPPGTSSYYVFTLNSRNTQEDTKDYDSLWNCTWQSAVFIAKDNSNWQAEIALPIAAFDLAGGAGPEWRLNLTSVVSADGGKVLTWGPTFNNFHSPAHFGRLMLDEIPWAQRECGLQVAAAPGQPGRMDVVTESFSGQAREGILAVTMKRPDGTSQSQQKTLAHTKVASTERFSFPTTVAGQHQFVATLRELTPEDGRKAMVLAERQAVADTPPPLDAWLDRSVYTDQNDARLTIEGWQTGLAGKAFDVSLVPAENSGQGAEPIKVVLDTTAQGAATLDISEVPIGRHEVQVRPLADGDVEAKTSCTLVKLSPQRGTVWFDDRGVLYKDEEPIFPFGFYYIQNFLKDGLLEEFVEAGMNTIVWEWTNVAGYIDALKRMDSQGVDLIVSVQNEGQARHLQDQLWQSQGEDRARLEDAYAKHIEVVVRDIAASNPTNLIAWYIQDEPNLEVLPFVKRSTDVVAAADPRRPNLVVPCLSTVLRSYADVVDILAPDPYPGFPDGPMVKVSSFLDEARAAMRHRRPAFAMLQAFGEPAGPNGTMPSPAELRCMTWLAIVHEARGVIYFSYSYNGPMREAHPELWAETKTCAGQIRDLGATLLSASAGPTSLSQTPASRQVHSRAIEHDGAIYVLAVNTQRTPIDDVQWTVSGVPDGPLEVLWEGRDLTVRDSTFLDDFGPLAVHVYRRNAK
jgi:hypothetical protein